MSIVSSYVWKKCDDLDGGVDALERDVRGRNGLGDDGCARACVPLAGVLLRPAFAALAALAAGDTWPPLPRLMPAPAAEVP
eukprot:4718138-Prymnesium_polylepis.1